MVDGETLRAEGWPLRHAGLDLYYETQFKVFVDDGRGRWLYATRPVAGVQPSVSVGSGVWHAEAGAGQTCFFLRRDATWHPLVLAPRLRSFVEAQPVSSTPFRLSPGELANGGDGWSPFRIDIRSKSNSEMVAVWEEWSRIRRSQLSHAHSPVSIHEYGADGASGGMGGRPGPRQRVCGR